MSVARFAADVSEMNQGALEENQRMHGRGIARPGERSAQDLPSDCRW